MSKTSITPVKDENLNFTTVDSYLRRLEYMGAGTEILNIRISNAEVLRRMPDDERRKTEEIMAHEKEIGRYAVDQWLLRRNAAKAKPKTEAQKAVMEEYGLYPETKLAFLLTLSINEIFNGNAERTAVKKDLSAKSQAIGYDINAGRDFLRKRGFINFYAP